MPVWNRESILELMAQELARSTSSGGNIAILMARIDPAKASNSDDSSDREILAQISTRLSGQLRPYDYVGRYGSKELLILVPGWERANTLPLAEKLRRELAHSKLEIKGSEIDATISIAALNYDHYKSEGRSSLNQIEILRQLEKALDRIQANGGNQVELMSGIVKSSLQIRGKGRRIRGWWIAFGLLALAIVALLLLSPTWTCGPNLIGDTLDSTELPPPLPANCFPSSERPSDATYDSLEKQRVAGGLELQATITCKMPAPSKSHRMPDQQWLGSLYADGKMQYRRHILFVASQDVPGGKLLVVEQCLVPAWKYLTQWHEYCRTQDLPWE